MGGSRVTAALSQALQQEGKSSEALLPKPTLKYIKENACYVSQSEDEKPISEVFELPDGQKIPLEKERNSPGEILFNPSYVETSIEMPGLHQLIHKSIMKTNMDIRKDMFANIVLSGGTTMMRGIKERLNEELQRLTNPNLKINVVALPNREHGVWAGASVIASLSTFRDSLISKQEFEEVGPCVVNKRT